MLGLLGTAIVTTSIASWRSSALAQKAKEQLEMVEQLKQAVFGDPLETKDSERRAGIIGRLLTVESGSLRQRRTLSALLKRMHLVVSSSGEHAIEIALVEDDMAAPERRAMRRAIIDSVPTDRGPKGAPVDGNEDD